MINNLPVLSLSLVLLHPGAQQPSSLKHRVIGVLAQTASQVAAAPEMLEALRALSHLAETINNRQHAGLDICSPRHQSLPFFAPYLDRACLRPWTPDASSAARITL